MFPSRLSGLRARLLLVVCVALLPGVGLALYSGMEQERAAAARVTEEAQRVARVFATQMDRHLAEAHKVIRTLAQLPPVRALDASGCRQAMSIVTEGFDLYANALVATPDGNVFCSAVRLGAPTSLADRRYFQEAVATRRTIVSEYIVGRVTQRPLIAIAEPVVEGEVARAVVVVGLDLAWANNLLADADVPPGSTVTLADRNGVILARHPDPSPWIGQVMPENLLKQIRGGSRDFIEAAGLDRRPKLFTLAPLGGGAGSRPGSVIVAVPRDAFAVIRQQRTRNLAIVGLVGLAAAVMAWAIGTVSVRRPVGALLAASRRLSTGARRVRLGPSYSQGELGQLERTFDETAATLEAREAALREAHDTLRAVIDNAALAIVAYDVDGRVTLWSPGAERLFGWTADEVLGRPSPTVPDADHAAFRARLERVLQGETFPTLELRRLTRDGGFVDLISAVAPLRDADGHAQGSVAIHRDVTQQKQTEQTLRHTQRLVEMGSLLAGVAHELNNPLAVVLGQAQLLRSAAGDGPLRARADKIRQAAERCARIVRNFLALARQRPPERKDVQPNDIVRDAAELLAYALRTSAIEVVLNLADELPPLWADPHQLHQVAVNLITNAQAAMLNAPAPRRLTLATRYDRDRHGIILEVADTGSGILPEIRQRIFEPFFTTKPVGQGTGLGLSICRGIVENHGGTIRVESEPGHGTRFIVELPERTASHTEAVREIHAELPRPRRATILIVDDEPHVAELLAEILATDGHHVDIALNGQVALERIQTRPYDLILSDLRMPELDGPGLYRELQRRDPTLCERVVFLTGDTLGPHVMEFLDKAGRPRLDKPFDLDQLTRVVRQVLGGEV